MTAEWDAATLTTIICEAIEARDFPAVAAALKMLAVTDPGQAKAVYETIRLGLALQGTEVPSL